MIFYLVKMKDLEKGNATLEIILTHRWALIACMSLTPPTPVHSREPKQIGVFLLMVVFAPIIK